MKGRRGEKEEVKGKEKERSRVRMKLTIWDCSSVLMLAETDLIVC